MQPKDRILDLYGAFGRDVGGWLAIADVIDLLGSIGVDEQSVRSAASRMKRNGLLVAERRGGAAGYALSSTTLAILEDGDARIFGRAGEPAGDDWVIAMFSVPESQRSSRYLIRSRLAELGFGQVSAAVWFAPAAVLPEAERLIERHDLAHYVSLWRGHYLGFDDLSAVVGQAWDLPAISHRYQRYLRLGHEIDARWRGAAQDDAAAFVDYLDNLACWRPLPYLDPGLPAELLPDAWPGEEARALFERLDADLRPRAQQFFRRAVASP